MRNDINPLPPQLRPVPPLPSALNLPAVPIKVIAWNRSFTLGELEALARQFPHLLRDLMAEAIQRLEAEYERQPLPTDLIAASQSSVSR